MILAKSPEILTLRFPGPKTENHTFGAHGRGQTQTETKAKADG